MTISTDPFRLKPHEWEQVRAFAERFEQAWDGASSVDLRPYLGSVGQSLRLPVLVELIKTDLEMRYRHGQPLLLEEYLKQFPEIGPVERLRADIIYEEYRVRQLHGDQPPLMSYKSRFPAQFAAVQQLVISQPVGTIFGDPEVALRQKPHTPRPEATVAHTPRHVSTGTTPAPDPDQTPKTLPLPSGTEVGLRRSPGPGPGSQSASSRPPLPDAGIPLLGGYTLQARLGVGQNGEVFRAMAPGGVEVAIKRLFFPLEDEGSKRELQALELIRTLHHPFLLQTHAYWVEDDRLHIVMERADGSLEDWFKECRKAGLPGIPVKELLSFFLEAAEALDYLHNQPAPVLHRDIKPANMLCLKGHAKVADFGLARLFSATSVTSTRCGTPVYMPPEIWAERVSVHSDQYSLAAAYAEMAQGRRVHGGNSQQALMQQHADAAPDLDGFNAAEQKVLCRALAKDPNRRYPTCLAFVQALAVAHAPPPVAPGLSASTSNRSPAWVASLLVGLLAAIGGLMGLRLLFPTPPSVENHDDQVVTPPRKGEEKKLVVPWLPPGFTAVKDAKIREGYFERIAYQQQGLGPIEFLLVSPTKKNRNEPPDPFYIMRDKVTCGQLEAARKLPRMDALLKQYGAEKLRKITGLDKNLPVMDVTVVEAHCFAELLGGKLPSTKEWDKAGGRFEGAKGPFNPAWKLGDKGIALDRVKPAEVGKSDMDESWAGCRDMAGNGREFTRDLDGRPGEEVPLPKPDKNIGVHLRGEQYDRDEPFVFAWDPVMQSYVQPSPVTGFRVVIDRLGH